MTRYFKGTLIGILGLVMPFALSGSEDGAELFDQVSQMLENHYYGFSKADPVEVMAIAKQTYVEKCSQSNTNCGFTPAIEQVQQALFSLQDLHTYIVPKEQLDQEKAIRTGIQPQVRALGVIIDFAENIKDLYVADVYDNSIALKYGIQAGDKITEVNNRQSSSFSSSFEFLTYLKQLNIASVELRLVIERQGKRINLLISEKIGQVTERAYISFQGSNFSVLKIQGFLNQQIARQVHSIIDTLNKENKKRLIIDLRYNLGGSGSGMLASVAAFVKNPTLAFTSRSQTDNQYFEWLGNEVRLTESGRTRSITFVPQPAYWKGCTPVVLVNRFTASSGEIFALMLQDKVKAIVIGEATSGIANTTGTRVNLLGGNMMSFSYDRVGYKNSTWFEPRVIPRILEPNDVTQITTNKDPIFLVAEKNLCP